MRIFILSVVCVAIAGAQSAPTLDQVLEVRTIGGSKISPDGKWVAYTVSDADWKQDAFVTQIWAVETASGRKVQLTRGSKSSNSPQWSPDGKWIAFTSAREGNKNQVYAIQPDGGEALQLTASETAVAEFEWSPDGNWIAFEAPEPDSKEKKDRKERLGDFDVVRRDYAFQHLWTVEVAKALEKPQPGVARTKGHEFSVSGIAWSPDSTRIAFSASVNPDLVRRDTADIYVLTLAGDSLKKVVSLPGNDAGPVWSPDGKQIAFSSAMAKLKSHANRRIAVVDAGGGVPRSLTDTFDESPALVDWKPGALYFSSLQRTASHLFTLDPASGRTTRVTAPDPLIANGFSLTRDGKTMAFNIQSAESLAEIHVSDTASFHPRKLTNQTEQVKGWKLGVREVISWKSEDGTVIEGILIKPADFDPTRKYPLLCVIHGGPTGIDRPVLLDTRYYPSDLWTARGALVLKVNYRGSAGYGEKFRQLNVRNLGVGDAWDVESGVRSLIQKGFIDEKRIACMGWSQGGYISAFLTTTSKLFAAISVGAGISNWATYYYNTDITPFTIHYLGADPAADPEIYRKTSPMSYIKQAKTPTLIQHGELDRRVPIPNAYELRQGLEDRGVKVEMIVYKGYGHGITKPKSMRAVMEHNMAWFGHYLWGDPAPEFVK
jgi:dipeptidyl aminopeptidase/acylaminoacyl peptidase